jgi:hypothetical protein
MLDKIVLVCTPLRFYTHVDEEQCFRWIKKIKSINTADGIGRELHLIMKSNKIPNKDLLELIGLFRRYNFDIKQLKVFMNEDNKAVFKSLDKI